MNVKRNNFRIKKIIKIYCTIAVILRNPNYGSHLKC